jgi:hypothetical protein
VVLLHGAGGVLPAREHLYGRQLAAMGAAALVVDVFGARRDRAAGFTERLLEITETMALADAYAALRFLSQRPEVDPGAWCCSASPTARWRPPTGCGPRRPSASRPAASASPATPPSTAPASRASRTAAPPGRRC